MRTRKKGTEPLGKIMQDLRTARNYSQVEVAAGVGCTRANVSQIERGKWAPTVTYLRRFAAFVGVTVDEVLARAEMHERPGAAQ